MSDDIDKAVCRFRRPKSGCDIQGTIRASTYRIMEKNCINDCKGAQGDKYILAWLWQRMRVEYTIVKRIRETRICAIIKNGGAVNLLHTKEYLVRKRPVNEETVELEMPGLVELAVNLFKTGVAIAGKLFRDTKTDGLRDAFSGIRACEKQIKLRKLACDSCPHRQIVANKERCLSFKGGEKGCGCFMDDKRKWAASRCIGKVCLESQCSGKCRWDDIDARFGLI